MKRAKLRANTTYALRRADDAVVPVRLLDATNLWSPLYDVDGQPTGEFRISDPSQQPTDERRRIGLLALVLDRPRPSGSRAMDRLIIERFARRLDSLDDLGLRERSTEGVRAWRARATASLWWLEMALDAVANSRILHLWGEPMVACPGCGRDGWVLDGEGRIPTHDAAPPLRAVCSTSGAVLAGRVAV
jgi:hypothetical protein